MSTDNHHEATVEAAHPATTGGGWASSAACEVWAAGQKIEASVAREYLHLTSAAPARAEGPESSDRQPSNPIKNLYDEATDFSYSKARPLAHISAVAEPTIGTAAKQLTFCEEKNFELHCVEERGQNITAASKNLFGFIKSDNGKFLEIDRTAPHKLVFHPVYLVKDGPDHYKAELLKQYPVDGGEVIVNPHPLQHIESAKSHAQNGSDHEQQNVHAGSHVGDPKAAAKPAVAAAEPAHFELPNPYADPNFF